MRIKKRKILEGVDRKNVSTFQRVFHNAMSDLMDEFKGIGIDTDNLDFKHDLEDQMEDFLDAYFDGKEYKKAYYGESLLTEKKLYENAEDIFPYEDWYEAVYNALWDVAEKWEAPDEMIEDVCSYYASEWIGYFGGPYPSWKDTKWAKMDESLKESYAVVRYWDNKGYLKNKIVNGSSSKDVEKKVSKLVDKYDVYDIDIASKDVADSEYFKDVGLEVHKKDLLGTRFDKPDRFEESLLTESYQCVEYDNIDDIDFSRKIVNIDMYGEDSKGDWDLTNAALMENGKYKVKYVYHEDGYGGRTEEDLGWYGSARSAAEKLDAFSGGTFEVTYADENVNESLLTEKQWKHQLSNGMEIRQAIEDEDYHALRKALLAAYSEIHDMMPDEFDDKDYDDAMSEIDLLDTKPDEDADTTAEDLEDSWNYELSDFYDLCDALDIWIPLNESLNEDEVEGKWAVYDSYSEELVDVYDTKEYAKEMVRHLHELQDNGMFVPWKGPFFAEPYYESLTEDTDGDALDEINDKFIGAYDNDEPHDDYKEEEVTEYDT